MLSIGFNFSTRLQSPEGQLLGSAGHSQSSSKPWKRTHLRPPSSWSTSVALPPVAFRPLGQDHSFRQKEQAGLRLWENQSDSGQRLLSPQMWVLTSGLPQLAEGLLCTGILAVRTGGGWGRWGLSPLGPKLVPLKLLPQEIQRTG